MEGKKNYSKPYKKKASAPKVEYKPKRGKLAPLMTEEEKKEADETDFWLNLLHDNGYINETQFESLSNDLTRILKILTSIVKTMRQKVGKN